MERKVICPSCSNENDFENYDTPSVCYHCGASLTAGEAASSGERQAETPAAAATPAPQAGAETLAAGQVPSSVVVTSDNQNNQGVITTNIQPGAPSTETSPNPGSPAVPGTPPAESVTMVTDASGNSGIVNNNVGGTVQNVQAKEFTVGQIIAQQVIIQAPNATLNSSEDKEKSSSPAAAGDASARKALSLHAVEESVLQKIGEVFVPPAGYDLAALLNQPDGSRQRVFLVYGEEHHGRLSCAIHLGLALAKENKKIQFYRRTSRDEMSLLELARNENLGKDGVFIIQQAFENGVSREDLSRHYLPELYAALASKNNFLILTTFEDMSRMDLPAIHATVEQASKDSFIEKHIAWYKKQPISRDFQGLVELVQANKASLFASYTLPYQVNRFFELLLRYDLRDLRAIISDLRDESGSFQVLKPEEEKELVIKALARFSLKTLQTSVGSWYADLSANQRLYAMLVGLFENVERSDLELIYQTAVEQLRKSGIEILHDPRQSGRDDILDALHIRQTGDGLLRFENSAYQAESARQVENYHYLLWSLVDGWLEIIIELKGPEHWEIRRSFGMALARLAANATSKLTPILDKLARHDSGGVVTVGSYALEGLCRLGARHYPYVLDRLEAWAKSGDPDLIWAAAASIWRVQDGILRTREKTRADENAQKRLWEILRRLVEDYGNFSEEANFDMLLEVFAANEKEIDLTLVKKNNFETLDLGEKIINEFTRKMKEWHEINLRAVLFAILNISRSLPVECVEVLGKWLESPKKERLSQVTVLVSVHLFQQSSAMQVQLTDERYLPLLKLMQPLFLVAPAESIGQVIAVLALWAARTKWAPQISRALADLIPAMEPDVVEYLIGQITANWLNGETPELKNEGRELLSRLYLMNGDLLLPPAAGLALVAVDAGRSGKKRNFSGTGLQVSSRVEARFATGTYRMGRRVLESGPEQTVDLAALKPFEESARLLLPGLEENCPAGQPLLLVAAAWDEISDLQDLSEDFLASKLIVIKSRLNRESDPPNSIYFGESQPSPALYSYFEKKVNGLVANHIRAAGLPALWAAISAYFGPDEQIEPFINKLEQLALAFTRPGPARQDMRTFAAGLIWLLQKDPQACTRLIQAWLEPQDGQAQGPAIAMGQASARLAIKFVSALDPLPSYEEYGCVLALIPAMVKGKKSWGSVCTILGAYENWLNDPAWCDVLLGKKKFEHLASGRVDWLQMLVENTPDDHFEDLELKSKKWFKQAELQKVPEKLVFQQALNQAAMRLNTCLRLGKSGELPSLSDQEKYVILFVDASNRRSEQLGSLAATLVTKLAEDKPLSKIARLLVCRLGQARQLDIQAGKLELADILPAELHKIPTLAGAFLDLVCPEQAAAVVVLSNSAFIDQEDWEHRWLKVPFFHVASQDVPIPMPDQCRSTKLQEKTEDTIKELLQNIRESISALVPIKQ